MATEYHVVQGKGGEAVKVGGKGGKDWGRGEGEREKGDGRGGEGGRGKRVRGKWLRREVHRGDGGRRRERGRGWREEEIMAEGVGEGGWVVRVRREGVEEGGE